MTATVLADLQLFSPEQAADVMNGDGPKTVTGYWIREQLRRSRPGFTCTLVAGRIMLTRAQIADIITACRVEPTRRATRRASAA